MKRFILCLGILFASSGIVFAQSYAPVLSYIQNKSDIREGGCDIFEYKGQSLLVAVVSVIVGNKTELNCQKVGSAKAKKEMLSFVNGAEITSVTTLETFETIDESLSGRKVESAQVFNERIKERVLGEINMTNPLGGWYSEDKSLYYFAIYKLLE